MSSNMTQQSAPGTGAVLLNMRSGMEHVLADTVTLGRMRKCDIRVPASKVSRYHARIIRAEEGFVLEDLDSRNGTYLDNRRVREPMPLHDGARILIGDTAFLFFERTSADSASAQAGVIIDEDNRPTIIHSISIEDDRLLENGISATKTRDIKRYLDIGKSLRTFTQRLRALRSTDAVAEELAKYLLQCVPWPPYCVVLLHEPGTEGPLPRVVKRRDPEATDVIRLSHSRLDRAMTQGCALIAEDETWQDTSANAQDASQEVSFGVGMYVPLLSPERAIGVFYMGGLSLLGRFDEVDLQLAVAVANEAAAIIDNLQLLERTRRERDRLKNENLRIRKQLTQSHDFGQVIGTSQEIRRAVTAAQRAATSNTNVLLQGEPGTGKRLLAELIHHTSPRAARRFVSVNCSAMSPVLLERLLFGEEYSASSTATRRLGLLESADCGTVLLDEVADLPEELQERLLRTLEKGALRPVGQADTSARFIATTERNLQEEIEQECFRADLYSQLQFTVIEIPPLRDRNDDIAVLAKHFHALYSAEMNKRVKALDDEALDILQQYHWPNNVRELRNTIERLIMASSPETAIATADIRRALTAADDS